MIFFLEILRGHQKLKSDSIKKKGYFQIDIMFVLLVFLILFYFVYDVYFYYLSEQNDFFSDTEEVSLANSLCYYLVKTPGYPNDWETNVNTLNYIGIKNMDNNSIDIDKLGALDSSNYDLIRTKLGLDNFIFIKVVGIETNTNYNSFGSFPSDSSGNMYTCYSNYNDEIVKVIVGVW